MYGERFLFIYFIAREFVKIKWQNNMIPYGSFVVLRPMLILFELTFVVILEYFIVQGAEFNFFKAQILNQP